MSEERVLELFMEQRHPAEKSCYRGPQEPQFQVLIDRDRDSLLTTFGKLTLRDRYLLEGESYQDLFARVAAAFADDDGHAQRLYDAMSRLWFMPATPVLANGGAARGMPISCFLNDVEDSLEGIVGTWNENVWLASNGGGIGTYWGKVRSIGETVTRAGVSSGIIPFIRVMDSLTLAISQGSLRRGNSAVYLDVHHPEIEEFLDIRRPSGDFNRKSLNIHHGVNITDEFMEAVRDGRSFALRSPKSDQVLRRLDARTLWQKILEVRMQTGEPYLLFIDTVNRAMPSHQKELGLRVSTSNLCSEIMLHTGNDHINQRRTAVCCLSSLNLETYDEWQKEEESLIKDVFCFLDNVLNSFIDHAPPSMEHARYSAMRERSVGLGVMGYHSYLQKRGIPFESVAAKSFNQAFFRKLRVHADRISCDLARQRGSCPDAKDRGVYERFSHKLAIAPTASISIICGGASACIEPIPANIYTHKTLSGSVTVKNRYLLALLKELGENTDPVWQSILEHDGSVRHLSCLTEEQKRIFKTGFEIDQRWIIGTAADRAPSLCQGQSINLYLPADVDKWDLHMLHWQAWEKGLKSLYYCRSKSIGRAQFAGGKIQKNDDYDECLSCQ